MWGAGAKLWRNCDGAVAPTVALSLIGLVAVGGVAFDYAHLAALDTELQQAADQAALAAATQLDGQSDAITRATAAADSTTGLVRNKSLLAGSGQSGGVINVSLTFCSAFDDSKPDGTAPTGACTTTTSGANAKVVWVTTGSRTASYALTPIVGLFKSTGITGQAVATMSSAICKTPPTMVCNPAEPANNANDGLPFSPTAGVGLKLVTGDATVPGNFGWLESTAGNGASALAQELGYNAPPGACQAADAVTTQTGMDKSVLNAFNTRFDLYANGNQTCPNQGGGTCSPSDVTRKDLVCQANNSNTACKNDNWSEASKPYRLAGGTVADLPTSGGATDPTTMGYPPDECHMTGGAGSCGVTGDGKWDRNAFFRVNYGWDQSTWQAQTGLGANATRYQVYQWERAHTNPNGKGISVPQQDGTSSNYAFGQPATGRAGVGPGTNQADRRVISVAVMNCQSLTVHGKTSNAPVGTWMDVFLVQPVATRSGTPFTDSNIYVEEIGVTTRSAADPNPIVLRRDRPYLIR